MKTSLRLEDIQLVGKPRYYNHLQERVSGPVTGGWIATEEAEAKGCPRNLWYLPYRLEVTSAVVEKLHNLSKGSAVNQKRLSKAFAAYKAASGYVGKEKEALRVALEKADKLTTAGSSLAKLVCPSQYHDKTIVKVKDEGGAQDYKTTKGMTTFTQLKDAVKSFKGIIVDIPETFKYLIRDLMVISPYTDENPIIVPANDFYANNVDWAGFPIVKEEDAPSVILPGSYGCVFETREVNGEKHVFARFEDKDD
jgi:hypothetical protein